MAPLDGASFSLCNWDLLSTSCVCSGLLCAFIAEPRTSLYPIKPMTHISYKKKSRVFRCLVIKIAVFCARCSRLKPVFKKTSIYQAPLYGTNPRRPMGDKKCFSSLKGHFGTVSCPGFPPPSFVFCVWGGKKIFRPRWLTKLPKTT